MPSQPSKTSKPTSKRAINSSPTNKDYEDLGKSIAAFYENGYLDKRTTIQMSLLKGIAGGFGGVIGATIVVALLLWILSFFDQVPFIDKIVKSIDQSTIQQVEKL